MGKARDLLRDKRDLVMALRGAQERVQDVVCLAGSLVSTLDEVAGALGQDGTTTERMEAAAKARSAVALAREYGIRPWYMG